MFSSNQNQLKDTSVVHYFKLPYIGNLLHHVKNKLWKLCREFCKENINIKLVFTSFKIKNYFSCKDPILDDLKSFLVYKFTCVGCSSSYIAETYCHFKTRIEKHINKDKKSHIFNHLHSTTTCFNLYNSLSFKIIDKANSKFDLKSKKTLYMNCRKANLNAQQIHLSLSPFRYSSRPPYSVFFCFVFICFCVSLSSIIFIIFETSYRNLLLP